MADDFFWLHVKKSAGQSTRAALGPLYTVTDRRAHVASIRDLPPGEWNDGLNNYRVPLGAFQFRRTEYARQVLWPDRWDHMMRVAFARAPVSRCVSMFSYLYDPKGARHLRAYLTFLLHCRTVGIGRRLVWSRSSAFDAFLETLAWQATLRDGPDPAAPINLHFATHTNPMSQDVLDGAGRSNLTHLIRLEHFEAGIDLCYREIGLPRPAETRDIRRNSSAREAPYAPTARQRRRIEALFADDVGLYESALRP